MAITISQINFQMNIPNISQLDSNYSPEIMVYDIPWKIKIGKYKKNDTSWLGAYLYCAKTDLSQDWSYAASSTIKLVPFDEKLNSVQRDLLPHIYNSDSKNWGYDTWIDWNDLFDINKKYVKNDKIKLDITIKMADPNDENKSDVIFENVYKSCEVGCLATFRLTVTNVDNLMAVRLPKFMIRNVPCYLKVFKHLGYIGLDIQGKLPNKKRILITLVSAQSTKSIERVVNENPWLPQLTSWDNLFKPENGFINCNSITVEVEVTVDGFDLDKKMHQLKKVKSLECAICLEKIDKQEVSSLGCGHVFCTECIKNSLRERAVCPLCKKSASLNDLRRVFLPFAN